jgi:hypothetical protein
MKATTKRRRIFGCALALALATAAFGAVLNESLGSTPNGPQAQVDFWNYDARTGKKTSNASPGVAARDLAKAYGAAVSLSGLQGEVDFWNYDARTGKKTSNASPGVAARDLAKAYGATP